LWIGTKRGPERKLVVDAKIPFKSIITVKWRRYFSWKSFFTPFLLLIVLFQSAIIILKYRPRVILSAGSFVSVPLIWVGWCLRIPIMVYQQDLQVGLANRLMTPMAKKIAVIWPELLTKFSSRKAIYTGAAVRLEIKRGNQEKARQLFNLETDLPTLLVMGGGTGARRINQLIVEIIPQLTQFCQIIHLTGGKVDPSSIKENSRYHPYNFLVKEMTDALAVADLVICRAGMGTLTELSALGKPALIIPIADNHQEINARYFARQQAVIYLSEKGLNNQMLLEKIKYLLSHSEKLDKLSKQIKQLDHPEATDKIAHLAWEMMSK
ncbi:MAG: UDP-N-acetylglucosamine--N-acetylmuramyl-(pentapeptide) pyrophosphoryl-undecaprenol N-acetylglucosamine transferase, partial [Candidatus Aenigmarchaeota archaeon]|nr:UDP-N-acetylglucosamine--N-acetylmuramyl-(pentapeptide) pyrophosphoryl-undecaprenol N-acetylglucosamine transferase [Candidatus Aenigmarchaeota archaeon]